MGSTQTRESLNQKSKIKMQNLNSKFKTDLRSRSYEFGLNVIRMVDDIPVRAGSHIIINQLIRSATSVGANLTEGRAASSRLEFKKFNEIALKSANETKYWLSLLRDGHYTKEEKINPLLAEVEELSKMIASGIMRLKGL